MQTAHTRNATRRTRNDRIFDIANICLMCMLLFTIVYPLYFIVIASFSDPTLIHQGKVSFIPQGITFEGYQKIFANSKLWIGYRNSLYYTLVGTSINVVLTFLTAYPLSRKDMKGRGVLMFFYTFAMIFSGGMIPTYMNVRSLHLINTVWALVLPGAILIYNLIIARTYFVQTIPNELLEASLIDGCSNWKFFLRVVLPLSPTLVAILILFYGVNHWNQYFEAMLYMSDSKKYPLQTVLRGILLQNEALVQSSYDDDPLRLQRIADQIKYGVIILGSAPLLMLYPFLQKYFVKGLMIGSVKG
jgi:putative aldouronate transport system permease protein